MINVKPCIPVVKESIPEAVKNILLHWHLVKGDKYITWKNGKFGRYCRDEYGKKCTLYPNLFTVNVFRDGYDLNSKISTDSVDEVVEWIINYAEGKEVDDV